MHKVLTRTTYMGRHRFNTKLWKTRERKAEVVEMAVQPIIAAAECDGQTLPKTRSPGTDRAGDPGSRYSGSTEFATESGK